MNKTVWLQLHFPVGSEMGDEHWMHHSSKVCRHLHSWWGTAKRALVRIQSFSLRESSFFDGLRSISQPSGRIKHEKPQRKRERKPSFRLFLTPSVVETQTLKVTLRRSMMPTLMSSNMDSSSPANTTGNTPCSHLHLTQENKTHLTGKKQQIKKTRTTFYTDLGDEKHHITRPIDYQGKISYLMSSLLLWENRACFQSLTCSSFITKTFRCYI